MKLGAKRWTVLFLLAAAFLVGGYYWATEPVRHMAPAYPEAAARDPYLAARTLLESWHRPSRRIFSTRALFPLPPTDTTLILDEYRGDLGRDRIQALYDWVTVGGHLVVSARPPYGDRERTDPLLERFGIRAQRLPAAGLDQDDDPMGGLLDRFQPLESVFLEFCLSTDNADTKRQCERLACQAPRRAEPALSRDFDGRPRRLQIDNDLVLHRDDLEGVHPTRVAANAQGTKLLQMSLGTGRVTAVAGLGFWNNGHLHYFDHAWLLHWLSAAGGPVWFVQGIDMPPLPLWLWERAWPPLLAVLLALALWLWRRLPRLGPSWQPLERDTTDYLGHLRALGHFYWRTDQGEALLAPLRDAARRRLALLHPDSEQALARAAERLALPEAELREAFDAAPRDRPSWTRRVAILQRIRSRA